jgi:hypothetical protein
LDKLAVPPAPSVMLRGRKDQPYPNPPHFLESENGEGDKMGGSPDQGCRDTLDRPILSVGRPGELP